MAILGVDRSIGHEDGGNATLHPLVKALGGLDILKVGPWGIHESARALGARQTLARHGLSFKLGKMAILGVDGSIGHEDGVHATLEPLVKALEELDFLKVGLWGIHEMTSRL